MATTTTTTTDPAGDNERASPCEELVRKRENCYRKHNGARTKRDAQKCWPATLRAKRCLAFAHCELEALHYYGTPSDDQLVAGKAIGVGSKLAKGLCSSFDEAYCFGNPQIMRVKDEAVASTAMKASPSAATSAPITTETIFRHHQKAKRRVVNNKDKFKACRQVSERMKRCVEKHPHVDWGTL